MALMFVVLTTMLCGLAYAQEPTVTIDMSTFTGSPGSVWMSCREVAFDSQGNIVAGIYGSVDPNGYPASKVKTYGTVNPASSVAVIKLDPTGSNLLWITFVGASRYKGLYGLAIDHNDNILCAGTVFSPDYYTTPGAFDQTPNGNVVNENGDAYCFKLDPDGSMVYSTYLGGRYHETARGGLAVDSQGCAYVVGSTYSDDYLNYNNKQPRVNHINSFMNPNPGAKDGSDGFVTKLSADGSQVIWNRFIGGSGPAHEEVVLGACVDTQGYVYGSGMLRSAPGIYTSDGSTWQGGRGEIYAFKLSPDGSRFAYATLIGGSSSEGTEHRMAIDAQGNAYIAGFTNSSDFPTPNGHDTSYGGGLDGVLIKLDPQGRIAFSTYIGGSGQESAFGPAVDSRGNIHTAGRTKSADFEITPNALDHTFGIDTDAFYQIYSPSGQLLYSTFLGSGGMDYCRFVAVDGNDRPVLAVETNSPDYPTTPGAYDTVIGGYDDALTRLNVSFGVKKTVNRKQ